jgi:hypothetical protein
LPAPAPRDRDHASWINAYRVTVDPTTGQLRDPFDGTTAITEYLRKTGESRWFKISARQGQRITLGLTANYSLALHADLARISAALNTASLNVRSLKCLPGQRRGDGV